MIEQAFQLFSKNREGRISIQQLKGNTFIVFFNVNIDQFVPNQHPDVKNGKKKETDVLIEFNESLNLFNQITV